MPPSSRSDVASLPTFEQTDSWWWKEVYVTPSEPDIFEYPTNGNKNVAEAKTFDMRTTIQS